jgi:long-chain acyl-CoA synthetase
VSAPQTLNELFFQAVDRFASKEAALRYKAGGSWHNITHHELARRVQHAALGLRELGINPGDKVAILSQNRPEWAIADYACLTTRCTDVAIYPTLPPSQIAYLLQDSGACAAFVEDREQYAKIVEIRDQVPQLAHVILFAPEDGMEGPGLLTLDELVQRGAAAEPNYPSYKDEALTVQPSDLATLIYTSGTTGDPKGVMLTHANFCTNVHAALQVLSIGPTDTCLSVLPLSHSFERMAGHYTMFHAGCTIAYAESIEKLGDNFGEVSPTVVLAVPRVFEKFYARVLENAMSGGALKRRIFFWARRKAEAWADLVLGGKPVPAILGFQKGVAHKLVFSKLVARTGGRISFFVSGAAALNPEIARFFFAAGLPIVEGYGLTETAPVIAANPLEKIHLGTVGPPIPGVEVKIAEDGEILTRGPNLMQGYYNKPDETREAIDEEGWFHTGDVGEFDEAGYVKITDRKKDLIVTAGGKNVAPQPIENMIKTNPFVVNVVMVGNKRRFPALLVVPDMEKLTAWAQERSMTAGEASDFLQQPDVVSKMEREVMGQLRDLASFEMPKKLSLVANDFTIESGELTPSMKVKRGVVEERYREQIDAMYVE